MVLDTRRWSEPRRFRGLLGPLAMGLSEIAREMSSAITHGDELWLGTPA